MRLLKLSTVNKQQRAARARAKRALSRFTAVAIDSLRKEGDGEFLQGGRGRNRPGELCYLHTLRKQASALPCPCFPSKTVLPL